MTEADLHPTQIAVRTAKRKTRQQWRITPRHRRRCRKPEWRASADSWRPLAAGATLTIPGTKAGGYGVSCPVRRRWPDLPPHHDMAHDEGESMHLVVPHFLFGTIRTTQNAVGRAQKSAKARRPFCSRWKRQPIEAGAVLDVSTTSSISPRAQRWRIWRFSQLWYSLGARSAVGERVPPQNEMVQWLDEHPSGAVLLMLAGIPPWSLSHAVKRYGCSRASVTWSAARVS